ncbi:hypothetical protein KR52_11075 [Synechococcus sp. KORDI-52]|uniref:hypothetical protein n=1 Tax=Synechococcus sp. KORDI-52 TaxID=585425 RepID=UPI0004E08F14|nr:hypothetical protein [Synechococcus sp. KORDI-52]AII49679.1 hypothetical protein KR52_11075 [Synechococcus sp. KORDI-52]
MGQIADALRANLKAVAESDARALRELDHELKAVSVPAGESEAALLGRNDLKALLGRGSFKQQTVVTLKRLCKQHGIKGYSKFKKPELCKALEAQGVHAPPPPLESFSKKELVAMLKKVMGIS